MKKLVLFTVSHEGAADCQCVAAALAIGKVPSYMSIFEAHHSITNLFKGCCCCCVNEPVPHLCHFDPDGPNSIERAKVAIEIDF